MLVKNAESSTFLDTCLGKTTSSVPVWFMRQAGRSLPEYGAVRGTGDILNAIQKPDLVSEITLQPVRRHGVDAAVLYSDIMVPLFAIDFGVEIRPGIGPVVEQPIKSARDIERIRNLEPEIDTPYVLAAVQQLASELAIPLLGFAGAPFTVACYAIEGGPSKNFSKTKAMMHTEPKLWDSLMTRLTDLAIASLESQVRAGADAVQLFDSWAGTLSPQDYSSLVAPHSARIFAAMRTLKVPSIHFGVGTGELLKTMNDCGPDVLGVDWRVPLDIARERSGASILQGNLDPAICLSDFATVKNAADDVLRRGAGGAADTGEQHQGHIFNLGHGVLPDTDPGILTELVNYIHSNESAPLS